MTRSLLERLRPLPEQPDPTWSAGALSSILRASDEPVLVVVGAVPRRSFVGRRLPAVLAVVVVLAGAGLGLPLVRDSMTRTVVAGPASPPPQAEQVPVATDLGPLPPGQRRSLVQACRPVDEPFPVVRVPYARSTSDGSGGAIRSATVVEDRRGEYRLCVSPPPVDGLASTEQSGYGPGVLGPGGDLSPTTRRPLAVISTQQYGYQRQASSFVAVHLGIAYAVTAGVDRVEVRLSAAGADGRWFAGEVHGGFAYIPVLVPELDAPDGVPVVIVESRGYDAAGRLVATDQQHYLNGDRDSHADERLFWG
ncbi:MAG TPA: hypothetical protein VGC37_18585 [Friedmanniella sp.]